MAPEVAQSQPYNGASDIYSLAILAWELAAQAVPFAHIPPADFTQR